MSNPIIVVCARDMGAESVTRPIAEKARDSGIEVAVVTEGLAGLRFIKAGFIPEFMGTVNFKTRPFMFDARINLESYCREEDGTERPSVLVVGESGPTNLEWQMGLAVRQLNRDRKSKIKVVECQDYWGSGETMPEVMPDRILTLDDYAKELVFNTHPYLRNEDVVVVGNPGVKSVPVSQKTHEMHAMLTATYEPIYFYAGGGKGHTEEELELLKQCLEMTRGKWILVVGWHPTAVKTYGDIWRKIVSPLGNRVIEAVPKTGDEWAMLADMTLSGTSTTMTTAVYAGNIATVLWTKGVEEIFRKRSIEKTPLAMLGCANLIERPTDLSILTRPTKENLAKLRPHDPEAAWQAVKELLDS